MCYKCDQSDLFDLSELSSQCKKKSLSHEKKL